MTKPVEYDATADVAFWAIIVRIRLIRIWAIVAIAAPVVRSCYTDAPATIASPMSATPMSATPMSTAPMPTAVTGSLCTTHGAQSENGSGNRSDCEFSK